MYFVSDVSTPANTTKADAVLSKLNVSSGFVYQVEIEFPAGCAGLVYCMIKDGGTQIWPSTSDAWFRSSNHVVTFPESYAKITAPFEFNIFRYNLDDTYAHSVQVRLGVMSELQYRARFMPTASIDELIEYFKSMEDEQQTISDELLETPFPLNE